MKFEDLSQDAKETAIGMIEICIRNGCGMGMDEGLTFDPDDATIVTGSQPFRAELEMLVAENQ